MKTKMKKEEYNMNEDEDDKIKMYANSGNKDYEENHDIENNDINDNNNKKEMMEYNEEEKEDEVDEKEKEEAGFINEEYIRNLMNYNVHNDVEDILNLNNKVSSGNDLDINNNKNNNNKIDNENEKEEEDDREIYKMFEDKLYKNEYINEKNQQMNKEKEKKKYQYHQ